MKRHLLIPLLLALACTALAEGVPTLVGRVTCEGVGVEGVPVSDGVEIVLTDANGNYAIESKKYQGTVFITTPSGYEPLCTKGIYPQFWAKVQSRKVDAVERHDFALRRVENDAHRMFIAADLHLSNRSEDLRQLRDVAVPAVRDEVQRAERDGVPAYSIIVGDLSSTAHWYSSEFDVDDAHASIAACKWPVMLYTAMGEQDYDGAVPAGAMTDYNAERLYVCTCGPKYYSMNIGRVHYVVLDNTVFRNDPGDGNYPSEIVGKRNYDRFITSDCLAWLRKDLALVEDATRPVVICAHHNIFRVGRKGTISDSSTQDGGLDSLMGCLAQRSKIHLFTAHAHRRRVYESDRLPCVTEHCVPSLSGNSWITAFDGFQHLCPDGTDPGFEIVSVEGDSIRWQYRTEQHGYRTFRAYDMNGVADYYRNDNDVRAFCKEFPSRIDYGDDDFRDKVYINWWCFEPRSKLEVMDENGNKLKVKQVQQEDPLFTVSSDVFRLKQHRLRNRQNKTKVGRNTCQHLFRVDVDSTMTSLTIRTTDRFGVVYEECMTRPKEFSPQMR